jgi:hypothetical protein
MLKRRAGQLEIADMDKVRLERFSYRFAEQLLNSKLAIKQEVESVLTSCTLPLNELSRPVFNKVLREAFVAKGWTDQPNVFGEDDNLEPVLN